MLPGRELINTIEQTLSDLDVDDWQLSEKMEEYIIDNGDYFLDEWQGIKRDFPDESTREKLNLILDVIQSEAYSECGDLQSRIDKLDGITDELNGLINYEDDED